MKRVYAIEAALLRLGLYAEVPHFIRQPVTWQHGLWRRSFWARHALTMRSRDGGLTRQGLCAVTEDYVERREWFYREFGENKDDVISALCHREFWAFNGWDADSWRDGNIRDFLSRYPDPVY